MLHTIYCVFFDVPTATFGLTRLNNLKYMSTNMSVANYSVVRGRPRTSSLGWGITHE
jgi:hypothetical protein